MPHTTPKQALAMARAVIENMKRIGKFTAGKMKTEPNWPEKAQAEGSSVSAKELRTLAKYFRCGYSDKAYMRLAGRLNSPPGGSSPIRTNSIAPA